MRAAGAAVKPPALEKTRLDTPNKGLELTEVTDRKNGGGSAR